jgi:HSP20 family protein
MALVRWSPVRNSFGPHSELNRLMDDFFGRRLDVESPAVWHPVVDIEESPEGYSVRAELPGMRLEDIKITVADNTLSIRGEKRREEEKKGTTYHRVERVYGAFERSFSLSHAVAADKIEATYRDGVLEVSIPKAEEAKAREIQVKVAK